MDWPKALKVPIRKTIENLAIAAGGPLLLLSMDATI